MKVLMLGWELPPHNTGGLGMACYSLSNHLSKKGVDIIFAVPKWYEVYKDIGFMRVIPAININFMLVPHLSPYDSRAYRYTTTRPDVVSVSGIFDVVNLYKEGLAKLALDGAFDIDIIHAHDWLTIPAALELKRILRVPLVVHIHATEHDRSGGNGGNSFVKELEMRAVEQADVLFPVSHHTAGILADHFHATQEQMKVAHNGPTSKGLPGDDERSACYDLALEYLRMLKQRGWKVLMSLGRVTIQKNLHNMFRAVSAVMAQRSKTMLVICGEGEQKNELIELAADNGMSENVFWGTDAHQAISYKNGLYSLSDLFLMPSVSEPFGLTPLEALDNQTLSIVSNTSGVKEAIPSLPSVDFWDVDKLSTEIIDLLDNEPRRSGLLEAASGEYSKLSWNDTANVVIDGYKQVMEERR